MSSMPSDYFDALYARDADPWGFESRAYEAEKYAATISQLPRARYRAGLEVGCSIGVLSGLIAERCDTFLGVDTAAAAVDQARARNHGRANMRFECMHFPDELPAGPTRGFDLVILSEVLYYFEASAMPEIAHAVRTIAAKAAQVMLVHWLGPTPDYPMSGDAAVELFVSAIQPVAHLVAQRREDAYRIDLLQL